MNIYLEQLSKLRELSGNAQIDYLNEIKSGTLKQILDYTYNPQMVYKIDKGKFQKVKLNYGLIKPKKKSTFEKTDWTQFTFYLNRLCNKRSATDDDVRVVKDFILSFLDEDVQSFLAMVLYKDLRLNMGIKKIQQVWPNFCVQNQLQLAENYQGKNFANGFYSRKFDGKRMYIIDGIPYSRQNKQCKIEPIKHILQELKYMSGVYVLDGELLYFDPYGKEDFQKAISLSSSDQASVDCMNLYFVVFDMMSKAEFNNQKSLDKFSSEYFDMKMILNAKTDSRFGCSLLDTCQEHILIARQVKNADEFNVAPNRSQWEGLMYRDGDATYQFKRTKSLLKIKAMQDGEFTLLDLMAGTGRNENRLGAISVKYKDTEVKVGSGYTDKDRQLIWDHANIFQSNFVSEYFNVKVQYFEETKDANGIPSLRFPVFLCFRHKYTLEEYTPEQVIGAYNDELNK